MTRTKENNHLSKYYTNKSIRKKIDDLLEEHASEQAKLGTDSKQKEIRKVVKEQLRIESDIKKLDPEYWKDVFEVEKK